ncbi:hypothetical protein MWU75_00760 [Ornithinimicrobium sp. F0845]|uniref:hypothetical protein n=1 Tax=Ornithinimicrobium sp. F0845 TaxID=2926412 RepID=UPI001FF55514|nr:hypothetical protein [Ornithinimicrobium sp. F0845]MCK0110677.1 hypothetical protein [Ornithinimicrobium sp. F0845]
MRWTAVAPVTWPSDQALDVWWPGAVAETLAIDEAGGGAAGIFEVDGQHVRLVSGEHLQPGAVYRWVPPEGAIGSAAWGIGGRPARRDVYLEYQEVDRPRRRVEVRVDGLDACGSVSATSTLEHLAAEASFVPHRDQLLDVEVRLDWLAVRLRARVTPAESGEQLRVSLRVVGRGIWRPVIAPLLVPVGPYLRHLLTEETEQVADRLTHLEEDPRGDGAPERELARIRAGAELIRGRLHEVVRAVDARPWWSGRRARHLREAFAALPAVGTGWPPVTPAITYGESGRWWDEEQWIFDRFLEAEPWRRKRHEEVDTQVDNWLRSQEAMVKHIAEQQAQLTATPDPADQVDLSTAAELNDWLDLSWLATPWSTVRHLMSKGSETDDDLPVLETDEDARRYVTTMFKEMRG